MNPAGDYDYMIRNVEHGCNGNSTIFGVLFANPTKTLVQEEILNNLEYANKRSGSYIDFYFAGYSEYVTNDKEENIIRAPGGKEWYFSPRMYVDFINQFEELSKWQYSGETELLLLEFKNRELCFDKVINIWIDKLVSNGGIYSVSNLFEEIYRGARYKSPTVAKHKSRIIDFVNSMVFNKIRGSIFDTICDVINKDFGKIIRNNAVYAVKNYSKSGNP